MQLPLLQISGAQHCEPQEQVMGATGKPAYSRCVPPYEPSQRPVLPEPKSHRVEVANLIRGRLSTVPQLEAARRELVTMSR
jgi:hypothetical protein